MHAHPDGGRGYRKTDEYGQKVTTTPSPLFILNGPNLNLLGLREPELYGVDTLDDIEAACRDHAADFGFEVIFRQTNLEGELIGWVQEARTAADALIINGAGFAQTSVALYDAVSLLDIPTVEVHFDNIYKREAFRQTSLLSPVVHGTIGGFGLNSYVLALAAVAQLIGRE